MFEPNIQQIDIEIMERLIDEKEWGVATDFATVLNMRRGKSKQKWMERFLNVLEAQIGERKMMEYQIHAVEEMLKSLLDARRA